MKAVRKISALVLCMALCFGIAACGDKASGKPAEVEVWSALNSEKIMRDVTYTDRAPAAFKVQAYRNETEGGQILMTPNGRVNSYSIALADLKTPDGKTLSKDTMTVYNQKYVEVVNPTKSFPTGWYPDALLPMEKAVEYGENKIEANENQAIYISVDVPKTQAAGVYTGTFTLTVDGRNIAVPASVEVWDYTLDDENHLRSVFSIHRYWGESGIISGELDSTWDMYQKYYDYLVDYRISPRYLTGSAGDIDTFIEKAIVATKDPRVTTYVLPYQAQGSGLNMTHYKTLMTRMMEASLTEGINLFKKGVTYFSMFDEANNNPGKIALANKILKDVKEANAAYAVEFRDTFALADQTKLAEYTQSMIDVVQLYVDEYEKKLNEGLGETYCPTIDHYNSADERAIYEGINEGERWWYTCLVPVNPFPSYHIDDNLYSSRIMSWMQYKYDITGNLYWSTTYWMDTSEQPLQDYYGVAEHYPNANGDGYLLYPGKVYGIDGPVGSIRLHSIRDGMEDYEVLYALGNMTAAAAETAGTTADVQSVLTCLYDKLFSGTTVSTDHQTLLGMRQTLAALVTAAENTGIVLLDGKSVDDKATFRAFVPDGATFTAQKTTEQTVNGGKIVTVTVPLSSARNTLQFTAAKGGKTYEVGVDVGGKRTVVSAETFRGNITLRAGDTSAVVSAATAGTRNDAVRVQMHNETSANKSFTYTPAGFSGFNLNTLKLLLTVVTETDIELRINVTGSKDPTAQSAYTGKLTAGVNEIEVDLFTLNWDVIGNLQSMRIVVVTDDADATVTIGDIVYAE